MRLKDEAQGDSEGEGDGLLFTGGTHPLFRALCCVTVSPCILQGGKSGAFTIMPLVMYDGGWVMGDKKEKGVVQFIALCH